VIPATPHTAPSFRFSCTISILPYAIIVVTQLTDYYQYYMGHETLGGNEQEHEGEKYLRLLGLDHLADQPIPGRDMQVRDFLDIDGERERALPMLVGFESLGSDDPRKGQVRKILRDQVAQHLGIQLES
jgi:hypothetical protein